MEEIKIGTIIELNDEAKVIAEKFVEDDQWVGGCWIAYYLMIHDPGKTQLKSPRYFGRKLLLLNCGVYDSEDQEDDDD